MNPFPRVIRIESAGRCNFKCTHCPVGIHGNTRPLMSFDMFVTIFDSLPAVPDTLVFYHGGEPLLNKELELLIFYAKQKGVKWTVFNSNAFLLTLKRAKSLAISGLDEMRVSFDGSSAEENDRIRIGSNFAKHAPIVKQAADLLNVVIYNVKFDGDSKPAQYLRDYFGYSVKYRTDLARVWAHEDKTSKPTGDVRHCMELSDTFSILSNGDVVSCCEDLLADYVHGNVLVNTPLEIWGKMQYLRDGFLRKDYPELCKHCWIVTGHLLESS
jgi:hypothetical protein